ncbi:uncharacterized protein LOC111624822 [Centruroides sculpturatus]|uniref:uncharacterized protein LOC111624822 n=1 Tax=Centruroides sculpturatus TaxID=218467 RepID=UPI000C6E85CD|nr:uncharacterized protein LOC111624822 [Centruroides sculpturatus]
MSLIRSVKNITNWGKDNETVTFDETVSYHFEEKLSKGKETDEVYLLNLPAVLIGFTLQMAFTLQLNIVVKQSDNLWYLRKMNETVFPVAWFTQTADLPEDFAKEVYDMIMTPQIYGKYAVMLVIGLGIMGISSAILNNIYPMIKKKKPSTPSRKILPINKNTSKTQVEKF